MVKKKKYKKSEDFIAKKDMVPTRYLDFIVGFIIVFILLVAANAVANSDKVITIRPKVSVVEPVRITEQEELPKLELITLPVLPIEQDKEIVVTKQVAPVEEIKAVTEEIVPVIITAPVVKPVEVVKEKSVVPLVKKKKAVVKKKKKRKKIYYVCCCKVSYDGSKRFKHRL